MHLVQGIINEGKVTIAMLAFVSLMCVHLSFKRLPEIEIAKATEECDLDTEEVMASVEDSTEGLRGCGTMDEWRCAMENDLVLEAVVEMLKGEVRRENTFPDAVK
ncbi:hypothetical protein NDU88_004327 [Pleurodeles waltl]|uniref:Phytosulfokine-beta n=1 Tax=Pleurodeles waltl TaxID=8319 RepID=A0AAV7W6B5_PLEWA|nr:hypothetical protein NDU88_004327 [Pleurodeles waltl]